MAGFHWGSMMWILEAAVRFKLQRHEPVVRGGFRPNSPQSSSTKCHEKHRNFWVFVERTQPSWPICWWSRTVDTDMFNVFGLTHLREEVDRCFPNRENETNPFGSVCRELWCPVLSLPLFAFLIIRQILQDSIEFGRVATRSRLCV